MAGKKERRVQALLDKHGRSYAEEIGIPVEKNTPAPLFQLLNAALLMSARIPAQNAVRAARSLIKFGLTTTERMAQASWQERVDAITWEGYKRYDERTATMLGDAAVLVLEKYGGDLRNLREMAGYDRERQRELLMELKGIGQTGASIFLREVQLAWEEVYPYADERVLKAAMQLELGEDTDSLARLVSKKQFPRLLAALIRVDLAKDYDAVR